MCKISSYHYHIIIKEIKHSLVSFGESGREITILLDTIKLPVSNLLLRLHIY